jgi:hypothetical protein
MVFMQWWLTCMNQLLIPNHLYIFNQNRRNTECHHCINTRSAEASIKNYLYPTHAKHYFTGAR